VKANLGNMLMTGIRDYMSNKSFGKKLVIP